MTDVGTEICILSLGQILAIGDESIADERARETLERHVRQVAAIIQGKPHNKPDEDTATLLSHVRGLLATQPSPIPSPEAQVVNGE